MGLTRRFGKTALAILLIWGFRPPARAEEKEAVVVMHGILNRPFMMAKVVGGLEKAGYRVVNRGYDSTERTVEQFAAELDPDVRALSEAPKVHFVGFSLGSIILRYYLSHYDVPNAGRFVQIAPPNHGSPMVDRFDPHDWFRLLYGDQAIRQLREGNKEFFEKCGVPRLEFGIIAGGLENGLGFNPLIPGDDDGSVPVESARLAQAKDFLLVGAEHTALLVHPRVSPAVARFLETGRFEGSSNAPWDPLRWAGSLQRRVWSKILEAMRGGPEERKGE